MITLILTIFGKIWGFLKNVIIVKKKIALVPFSLKIFMLWAPKLLKFWSRVHLIKISTVDGSKNEKNETSIEK